MIMIRIMEEMWYESRGNGYSMFNWVRRNDNEESSIQLEKTNLYKMEIESFFLSTSETFEADRSWREWSFHDQKINNKPLYPSIVLPFPVCLYSMRVFFWFVQFSFEETSIIWITRRSRQEKGTNLKRNLTFCSKLLWTAFKLFRFNLVDFVLTESEMSSC